MFKKRNLLILIIVLSSLYIFPGISVSAENKKVTAVYKSMPIVTDGIFEGMKVVSYTINKSSYVRIWDIAYILWNTDKQIEVSWDSKSDTIKLTTGKCNSFFAGEIYQKEDKGKKNALSQSYKIYLDGKLIKINAYFIDGESYFKLTDIAQNLDVGLLWDEEMNRYAIITTMGYEKNQNMFERYNLETDKESELADANYLGMITKGLQNKMDKNITRAEFCELVLKTFFIIEGRKQEVKRASTKTFKDTKDDEILKAYSLELIKNNKMKTFRPNDLITKEEVVEMLQYFMDEEEYYWKINFPLIDTDSILYDDNSEISERIFNEVYCLKATGILNNLEENMFYPKANMTVEAAVIMMKRLCREFKPDKNEISIGGKIITLGMSEEDLISNFGKPQRKKYDSEHIKYVYNSNPENFFIAGVCQGRVIYLYTNAKSFLFNDKSFGSYAISYYYTCGTCEGGKFKYVMDENADYRIFAVELETYCNDNHGSEFFFEKDCKKTALEWEQDIFDMTNAFRVCYGLQPLLWSDKLAEVARKHSYEMSEHGFISHYSLDGRSPWDRMEEVGITYSDAGENAAYLTQYFRIKSYEMFIGWVNSAGHREGMLRPELTHLGVGVAIAKDTSAENLSENIGYWGTQDFIGK